MVKLFGLIPKRPDLTDEQFHAHWASTHKELALRIAALRRYVQSHRVPIEVPGMPSAPYEGIAEVWLDDVATALGLADDPDYTQNAKLDEGNFIDVDRHGVIVAHEHVLLDGPRDAPGIKLMLLLRRADGVGPDDFAGAIMRLGEVGDAHRVVAAMPVQESHANGNGPPYDAVLEASFADERPVATAVAALAHELDPVASRAASCGLIVEELHVM